MGLWRGDYHGLPLGWRSPVLGPVHPKFVEQADRGGLGWLAGFDELARAAAAWRPTAPPGEDAYTDGSGRTRKVAADAARPHRQPAGPLRRGPRQPRPAARAERHAARWRSAACSSRNCG